MGCTLAILKPEVFLTPGALKYIWAVITAHDFLPHNAKIVVPSREVIMAHYHPHRNEPYFNALVDGMAGQKIQVLILEHSIAVPLWRRLMGPFREEERKLHPETIRGKWMRSGDPVHLNFVHGSSTEDEANREISLWKAYGI